MNIYVVMSNGKVWKVFPTRESAEKAVAIITSYVIGADLSILDFAVEDE